MIFARDISDPLTSLVKKMDEATGQHQDAHMGSFIVFCSDNDDLEKQLKTFGAKEDLKNLIVTLWDDTTCPTKYKVPKEAEVTVVLYKQGTVQANYAFPKGELNDQSIEQV